MIAGNMKSEERWKTIPCCPSYEASTFGRIRRSAPVIGGGGSVREAGEALAQRALPLGHMQVTVSVGNHPRTYLVHRLVADTFLPPPQDGQDCVLHRDDIPANNPPENLFWGNRRENTADMVGKGRQAKGERVGSAKLDAAQVTEIRARAAMGENQYDLAATFGVRQSNVSIIVARKTWKHLR